jgi:hypothetical protein
MKPATKRPVIVLAICAVCALVFLVLWARGFVPLQQMEFFAQDWQTRLGRKTPRSESFTLWRSVSAAVSRTNSPPMME